MMMCQNYVKCLLLFSFLIPESLLGDVFRWKPPMRKGVPAAVANEAVNILFFGWTGSGKSALLNAIMSCFSEAKEELAVVMQSEKHVTEVTQQYTTDMLDGMDRLNVQLWDSPGVDPGAYVGDVFRKMMEGAYRRYNLYQENQEDEDDILGREERVIHCVVFVASQGGVDDDVQMMRLREFVEETTTKGIVSTHPYLIIFILFDDAGTFSFIVRLTIISHRNECDPGCHSYG
jgi:hypothetical protein